MTERGSLHIEIKIMLELFEISKNFGNSQALDAVSLKTIEGEMMGLVGPNGSGKSTLLKIMLGLVKPSSGKVLFNGVELAGNGWKAMRERLGYMPERVSFYDNLTGRETLELFTRVKGGKLAETRELLKKVGLEEHSDRKVGGYSKGMRQRLNLAQALSNDPDILILDEPSSGLDPVGTRELYEILDDVRSRKKLTVILSSHILAEIEDRIDRVAVMKAGELKAIGSLEQLYSGFNLLLRVFITVKEREPSIETLLQDNGALDIIFKNGLISASIQRKDKLKLLSDLLMKRSGSFIDISVREPNLEEVFFGLH